MNASSENPREYKHPDEELFDESRPAFKDVEGGFVHESALDGESAHEMANIMRALLGYPRKQVSSEMAETTLMKEGKYMPDIADLERFIIVAFDSPGNQPPTREDYDAAIDILEHLKDDASERRSAEARLKEILQAQSKPAWLVRTLLLFTNGPGYFESFTQNLEGKRREADEWVARVESAQKILGLLKKNGEDFEK